MIQAIGNKVMVQPDTTEEVTKSGIYIPESAQSPTNKGTVISVGKGTKDNPMLVEPGQRIKYERGSGMGVQDKGKSYLIMLQYNIITVIED